MSIDWGKVLDIRRLARRSGRLEVDVIKAIDRAADLGFPSSWIDYCLRAKGLGHLLSACSIVEAGIPVAQVLGMAGHQTKEAT
jgi:hypothetical protein